MNTLPTFEGLMRAYAWEPIAGCPGRYILRNGPVGLKIDDLAGPGLPIRKHRVAAARDVVLVIELPDGGLISYEREDGTCVHTLNTPEGFRRKLGQLGIA